VRVMLGSSNIDPNPSYGVALATGSLRPIGNIGAATNGGGNATQSGHRESRLVPH
jgi:hypothetical protein